MSVYKMLFIAVAGALVWTGVGAVCFASIATVPVNLVRISHQKPEPAPAPPISVAFAR